MARIDIAMLRSRAYASTGTEMLTKRIDPNEIMDKANNVKTTLSSWDNCMAESYCKWPVIAGIIVGGLILFSIVWCIIRCACCGLSCCCSCFACFKCCGDCCGCCDSPNKKHKHLDEPHFTPAIGAGGLKQGYQAPEPMMAGGWTPGAAAAGGLGSKPQFATFETGPNGMAVDPALKRSVNEDALPPMPSWEGAAKKRISVEDEPNAVPLQQLDPATGQQMPLMSGAAGNISRAASPNAVPLSPYGEQQSGFIPNGPPTGAGYGAGAGALAGGAVMAGAVGGRGRPHDPYRQDSQSTRGGYNDRDPYSQQNGGYGAGRGNGYPPPQDEPYNPSFPNSNQQQNGYDNPYSPNPMNNQGYNDGSRSPGYNDYNTGGVGYASSNPSHTPRPYNERAYSDNRPQMPAGPLSNPSYGERNDGYGEPMRSHTASPPMLSNTSGYQQQGYGAPQRTYTGSTAPPSYVSRAPTMNNQGPQGYGGTRY